jgi:hypothetical protein
MGAEGKPGQNPEQKSTVDLGLSGRVSSRMTKKAVYSLYTALVTPDFGGLGPAEVRARHLDCVQAISANHAPAALIAHMLPYQVVWIHACLISRPN